MIHLGTSGYSFQDWLGNFYPPGIPQGQMLNYYAQRFSTVEINSTYYRLPHPKVMWQLERKTPPHFRFLVKFHGDVTHRQTRDAASFAAFARALEPLEAAGKFDGALAQFPFAFRDRPENREYLRYLRQAYGPRPLFVEFRHDSWARDESLDLLRELEAGFCVVDEPDLPGLFPPLVAATGEVGYVRLHGRNAREWWKGAERYNYLYSDAELQEWAGRIRDLAGRTRETFVFFNNCHEGHAAQNAQRMGELLGLRSAGE
jgi:uncharacterized protein YecE (DUF72 family)